MRSRTRAVLGRSAESLALGGIFVAAALGGLVLHADLQATRRLVVSVANQALGGIFQGRIVSGELEQLSLGTSGRVHIAQASIFDPDGQSVIHAKGIDARIDLAALVRSIAAGRTPEVRLDGVRIDSAEVIIDLDANGDPGIARAFLSRPSTTPKPVVAGALREDVALTIPRALVHHAWVHGNVVPPQLDGDADDIIASVSVIDNQLKVDVAEARLTLRSPRGPGQVGNVVGRATGELGLPVKQPPGSLAIHHAIVMRWEFQGDGGGIPVTAHLGLDHDLFDATADVPTQSADVIRRAFPALPLARPVELHAHAQGKLPLLAVTAHGRVGDSSFTGQGDIALRENQPFHFDADLTRADAAAFGGPASDVSGHVHVEGDITGGAPVGTFKVITKESTIQAQRAPAIAAEGTFDSRRVTATFRASEPGVDVDGTLELHVPEEKLDFDVHARSRDLRILARAPGVVAGTGTAHARGTLDLATATVHARVTADGAGITRAPASAESVHIEATVTGPVASPIFDVTASGKQIRLTALGPDGKPKEPLSYPSATGHGRIVLTPTPRILGAEVHVEGADDQAVVGPGGAPASRAGPVVATAREIRFGKASVEVDGAHVEGLGAPVELDMHVVNGALSLRAKATDVDLQRVAALTGIKELRLFPEGSRATLDVDVKSTGDHADGLRDLRERVPRDSRGHFDVSISGAKDGTAAELHGRIDGHHVTAKASATVGKLGWVELQRVELELPGAPSVSTLKRATGSIDLRGEIDLSQGAALFAGELIEKVSGVASLSARIERGDPRNLPTVYGSARTRGLDVTFNNEGKSSHIGGIDGQLHVGYDGATDETETSLLTWDEDGILASGDLKARVPLVAWVTGAKKVDRGVLAALEVAGVLDMPGREIDDLPGILAQPDVRGEISARAELAGSMAHPNVFLVARAEGLGPRKGIARRSDRYRPIDVLLNARWDGDDVVATVTADEDTHAKPDPTAVAAKMRQAGHVRGLVIAHAPAADLVAGRPLAWNLSGELDIIDLELTPLPLPQDVRGALSGHVRLRDLSGTPLLDGAAHIDGLTFGGARVKRGELTVEAKDGSIDGTAAIIQSNGGSGRVHVLSSALQWHGTDVGWDATRSTRLDYAVDRMRLSILRPLVRSVIPEIDGRVDGTGSAAIDAKSQVFEGGLSVSQGRLYVNAIGEEITEIGAIARFERNGIFRISEATGRIGAGEIKASATGRMKGLRFEGAEAVVIVPSKEGVPLSAEGAAFAQATGEVELSAKVAPDGQALLVTVAVPRSRVTLPNRGTQRLQSLDPNEAILIGIRQKDGTLLAGAERPEAAKRTRAAAAALGKGKRDTSEDLIARFTVAIGDEVQLEGRGLKLFLGGRAVVDVTDEVDVTGQITLRNGGTIDVQGRKFIIDRGTVTFFEGGNPADPLVVAAAYWDAPDRTRVWVEFNGPLKSGKLTLRSEPSYSKNEILSILLFGRADPNSASASERPSDAQAATAVGTGIASSGLNQALGALNENLEFAQERTSGNRVLSNLGYRLRRNVTLKIGYASGLSQREPDTTYFHLDWQFVPKWSLVGTYGDRGTSILDVLFQHRY